jgi:transcription antitermination factor NusG
MEQNEMEQNERDIQWYAIQVRSRHEFSAARILQGKGFEPFVPQYNCKRTWSDREIELDLPLFPGYIFCRLDARVRMPIMTTPGVVRIVGSGKEPLPIEGSEIEAVQQIVRCGCKAEPCSFLAIGSQVVIKSGRLAGLKGVIESRRNRHLIVSIALVQRSISIQLDDEALSIVEAAPAPVEYIN